MVSRLQPLKKFVLKYRFQFPALYLWNQNNWVGAGNWFFSVSQEILLLGEVCAVTHDLSPSPTHPITSLFRTAVPCTKKCSWLLKALKTFDPCLLGHTHSRPGLPFPIHLTLPPLDTWGSSACLPRASLCHITCEKYVPFPPQGKGGLRPQGTCFC